jgi:hypothetical protein
MFGYGKVEDSRDVTLENLDSLLENSLRASLIAQLCARGDSLNEAVEKYSKLSDAQRKELAKPDGRSGFLEFQWVADSLIKVRLAVSKIVLRDFWEFVRAGRPTNSVYESHLKSALGPINDSISGIRPNLETLYKGYPGNKVTGESLPLLRQIQESTNQIEMTIDKLLALSPPAKRRIPRVSLRLVIGVLFLAIASIPLFYWISTDNGPAHSLSATVDRDISAVQQAVKEKPLDLPKVIFADVIPMLSNVLLLVTALLAVIRACSSDARKDTKRMSEELTAAAEILRKVG